MSQFAKLCWKHANRGQDDKQNSLNLAKEKDNKATSYQPRTNRRTDKQKQASRIRLAANSKTPDVLTTTKMTKGPEV